jgi:hypothetical protein
MAKIIASENAVEAGGAVERKPVVVVGFGRGASGKSTVLSEIAYRALNKGRDVLVADFDAQSKSLRGIFPDAIVPESDDLPVVKSTFSRMLNRVGKEKKSAVVDFGGGDQFMKEMGKDLKLVEFCEKRGIQPLAVYVLSPDVENLRHCLSVFESGHFLPKHAIVVLNEGAIRVGKTTAGAFEATMKDPGFQKMVQSGVRPLVLNRLPCMDMVKGTEETPGPNDFYAAASGEGENPLDMVESFMVETWLAEYEDKRLKLGIADWLP